jgi:drug/metabolite transporter (DMT)-like permease
MKTRTLVQILILSAVWGISFLMIRVAGTVFPPLWVSLLRSSLGALLLWGVLLAGGNALPPRRVMGWLTVVALFNNAIPFALFALGEKTVPSNIAGVINATTPIWTLLLSIAIFRVRMTGLMIGGVLLAFAGVVVVVMNQTVDPAQVPGAALRGSIIIGLAALGYAIATVIAKAKLKGFDPIGLATVQLSLAAGMVLPFAVTLERPAPLSWGPVAAISVLGFAGSGLAYLLYYKLLGEVSATQVVAVTYLLPLWGLMWGAVAHEAVGVAACVGVGITIAGLVILNWKPAPKKEIVACGATE